MEKIRLVVCENYKYEFQAVLNSGDYSDVELVTFPSLGCILGSKEYRLKEWLDSQVDNLDNSIIICCEDCNVFKDFPAEPEDRVHKIQRCFNLFMDKKSIDGYIQQGAYIVTVCWLKRWKNNIDIMGFNQEVARKFFGECTKKIVFLDSGLDSESKNYLERFSEFVGLPYIIEQVELDYLELYVAKVVNEERLKLELVKSKNSLLEQQKQNADFSVVCELMSTLTSLVEEKEIIDKVVNFFRMLFAPQKIEYVSCFDKDNEDLDEQVKEFIKDKKKYIYTPKGDGFLVRISFQEETLGVIILEDFILPQYRDRYLNFTLNIVNVCSLAISNARKFDNIKSQQEELNYLSTHDALTGLFNRLYFERKVQEFQNDQKLLSVCVIMCDVNGLKKVNDSFGHAAGDILIAETANTLKGCFRELDIVARIGGDEFAVLIPNGDQKIADVFTRRISAMAEKISIEGQLKDLGIVLSISVGYSISRGVPFNLNDLLQEADTAMYEEKARMKKEL
ncbi:MAG: diguanylate cyclase [Eubacteriales bacterium]